MPPAEGTVVLANQGPPTGRSPVAQHSSVRRQRVHVLNLLKNFGGELGVQAGPDHFDATIDRTLEHVAAANTAHPDRLRAGPDRGDAEFDVYGRCAHRPQVPHQLPVAPRLAARHGQGWRWTGRL